MCSVTFVCEVSSWLSAAVMPLTNLNPLKNKISKSPHSSEITILNAEEKQACFVFS